MFLSMLFKFEVLIFLFVKESEIISFNFFGLMVWLNMLIDIKVFLRSVSII